MEKKFVKRQQNYTLSWVVKNEQGKSSKLISELEEAHLENILMSLGRNKRDQYINGVSRVTYIVGITEELAKRRHEKHMLEKESDGTMADLKAVFPNLETKGFEKELAGE